MDYTRMTPSFDYSDIEASIRIFMQSLDEFKDVNFDGSAAKAMIRVLAYNTMLQQSSNNFLFNELDIRNAVSKDNVAAIASGRLGYLPSGKKAAVLTVNVVVTPPDINTAPARIVMQRNSRFFATKDGAALNFSPDDDYEATLANGVYTFSNVKLLQGVWETASYFCQSEFAVESFKIPNKQIDIDSMVVGVRANELSTTFDVYKKFDSAYDLGSSAKVYFPFMDRNGFYTIEFGDGKLARKLSYGEIVVLDYLITDGEVGNGIKSVTPVGSVGGFYDVAVTTIDTYSYGGSEPESIEVTRKLAPLTFATQGSAVSPNDYIALTKKLFPEADNVISWGGELNDPPRYGYQMVAVKPKNGDKLTAEQKKSLISILSERAVGSITPLIVDPDYTYIDVDTEIIYNSRVTLLTQQSLKAKVSKSCSTYSTEKLEYFGSDFIFSNLTEFITKIDGSFKGNATTVKYLKRFVPEVNFSGTYAFNIGIKLAPGTLKVSGFRVDDTDFLGYTYELFDQSGVVKLKKYNSGTGNTYTFPGSYGSIDYTTGVINITPFRPNSILSDYVELSVSPSSVDPSITGYRNTVLKINRVNVELKDKKE